MRRLAPDVDRKARAKALRAHLVDATKRRTCAKCPRPLALSGMRREAALCRVCAYIDRKVRAAQRSAPAVGRLAPRLTADERARLSASRNGRAGPRASRRGRAKALGVHTLKRRLMARFAKMHGWQARAIVEQLREFLAAFEFIEGRTIDELASDDVIVRPWDRDRIERAIRHCEKAARSARRAAQRRRT